MKANKLHDTIRKRLVENRKECLECLYPEDDYEWGAGSKDGIKKTLNLVNKLLRDIPTCAWPNDNEAQYKVASGNWGIVLGWDYEKGNRRTADLRFKNNDHTAWVIESTKNPGEFVNYDIGGS